jgi:hypothetical protein
MERKMGQKRLSVAWIRHQKGGGKDKNQSQRVPYEVIPDSTAFAMHRLDQK